MYLYIWRRKWQLQYSWLGNVTYSGGCWTRLYGVTKHPDMTQKLQNSYIPSVLHLSPPSHSIPLGHLRESGWAPVYTAAFHQIHTHILHMTVYVDVTFSNHPTLSFPSCVYMSIPHVCIYIPSLQICSSPLFSQILYIRMCVLIYDIYYSLSDCFTLYNRLQILPPHCN